MQSTLFRHQQILWAAFRAAKSRPQLADQIQSFNRPQWLQVCQKSQAHSSYLSYPRRFYSDQKSSDIEQKVEDAKRRIHDNLDSRADNSLFDSPLKQDETIIHTHPESSSIVHTRENAGEAAAQDAFAKAAGEEPSQAAGKTKTSYHSFTETLPSQLANMQSQLRHRFASFMDNFQANVFVASQRLNDLTGYSGIEALKKEIEAQESSVRDVRALVKETREKYSDAIANRSDTQREVNDLLHRKHAWTPVDLERFTNLYRSDHANEQTEQQAHEAVSQAEAQYEEASARLAKSILARYHEEQIWSDKIRQMSTWGTWGLMGLNVLLFIVFQILIEPWRRKRLVRGFEEKVQAALNDREREEQQLSRILANNAAFQAQQSPTSAADQPPGQPLAATVQTTAAADGAAATEAATRRGEEATNILELPKLEEPVATQAEIEAAIEDVSSQEIVEEDAGSETAAAATMLAEEGGTPDVVPPLESDVPQTSAVLPDLTSLRTLRWRELPAAVLTTTKHTYNVYAEKIRTLFTSTDTVSISRKDLTTSTIESAAVGAAVMATFLWAFSRGR